MPRVKVVVDTGFGRDAQHIDERELNDELWASLTEQEQEAYLVEISQEFMNERVCAYAEVIE